MKRLRNPKGKSYNKYAYPMICNNKHCDSPQEFHIISHTHIGNPQNFITFYCPFCGQGSMHCDKCGKPNYECECDKGVRKEK